MAKTGKGNVIESDCLESLRNENAALKQENERLREENEKLKAQDGLYWKGMYEAAEAERDELRERLKSAEEVIAEVRNLHYGGVRCCPLCDALAKYEQGRTE